MMRAKWLLAGASVASLLVGSDAIAQPTAGAAVSEEVIVTARRREETLQDVPIAVTALSGEDLENKKVENIQQLQSHVPGLSLATTTTTRDSIGFAIRGQRTNEVQILSDPPVGTYFAEVVQPRNYGFGYSLYDLQGVQVLKGVQGTLFGRNMTAGAILVEPQHPKNEWEGEVKGEAGNYGMWSTYGMVNLPLVEDKLAVRLNGIIKQRDGFTINTRTGRDYDDLDYWSGRASFLLTPNDRVESLTVFDYLDSRTNGTGSVTTYLRQTSDARGGTAPVAGILGAVSTQIATAYQQQQLLGPRRVVGSAYDFNRVKSPFPGNEEGTKLINWGITNNTKIDLGPVAVKNIFGYRLIDRRMFTEFYHLGINLISSNQADTFRTFSEELQFQGNAFDDRLTWTAGGFGFLETGQELSHSIQFNEAAPLPSTGGTGRWVRGVAISYAIYGAGEFTLTDRWKLSGGLRWNHDQRSIRISSRRLPLNDCAHTGVIPPQTVANCSLDNGDAWRSVTWDVTLRFEPDAYTTLYGSQRKGFRSGGFGARATNPNGLLPFAPEFVNETEFGVKKQWDLNGARLTTNAALFYDNVTNAQVQLSTNVNNMIQTLAVNTGAQKNYGGELETTLTFPFGLDLSGYYAFVNVADTVNRPFNALIGVPKHQLGGSANYTFPVDESIGKIVLGGDIGYKSQVHLDDQDPNADQSGYALTNFHLNWDEMYGTGLGLGLFVTNVFDKTYRTGVVALDDVIAANSPLLTAGTAQSGSNVGLTASVYGEPRMFGGTIRYKF